MILFWLICAILVATGLAFVMPPLLQQAKRKDPVDENKEANVDVYRDQLAELETEFKAGLVSQEQYDQDREEFERRLLEDVSATARPEPKASLKSRNLIYGVALIMPVAAVALYLFIGHSSALSETPAPAGRASAPPAPVESNQGSFTPERIEANVAALAKKLEQNPDDVPGWIMLARSYTSLGKYSEASAAYKKAVELKKDDADLLANYAFTLGMANNRTLLGEPTEIIKRALKVDPENPTALELAGSAAFEAKEFQQAINYWEKLMKKTEANTELGQALTERINEAKSRLAK